MNNTPGMDQSWADSTTTGSFDFSQWDSNVDYGSLLNGDTMNDNTTNSIFDTNYVANVPQNLNTPNDAVAGFQQGDAAQQTAMQTYQNPLVQTQPPTPSQYQPTEPQQNGAFQQQGVPIPPYSSMQMQPPTPSTTTEIGQFVPDTSMGPSYDPRIGWYFPAIEITASAAPTPRYVVSEGYTPMSSAPVSTVPSRVPSPNPFGSKGKIKYGPAEFVKEQARHRVEENLAAGNSSASNSFYADKSAPSKDPLHNVKNPTIVQVCLCSDKQADKIPRPRNAFILYRSANSQAISRQGAGNNQDISRIAGDNWRKESQEVKEKYHALAEEERLRHAAKYPNYKYRPRQTELHKFGSASCRCGAFQANMAYHLAKNGGSVANQEMNGRDRDDYEPPRHAARPPFGPVTKQLQQQAIPDPSAFGLPTPRQQAEAEDLAANLKRKRDADLLQSLINEVEERLPKRRSQRSSTKDVSYTEPSEDDIFQSNPFDQGTAFATANPSNLTLDTTFNDSSIAPSNSLFGRTLYDPNEDPFSMLDDTAFVPMPSFGDLSSAFNTRSAKAKSKSPVTPSKAGPSQTPQWHPQYNQEYDLDAPEASDGEESEGDNIVVADHRSAKMKQNAAQASPTMSTRSMSKSSSSQPRRSSRKTSK